MSLPTARSIDALAELTADADVVLTADAPLALALDRRTARPRLGRAGATPRSHVSGEIVPEDTRPLYHELVETTDLPWKSAARALELCLDCWTRTGDLHRITDYPEFDTDAVRATVGLLEDAPSSFRSVAETRLDADLDVAVVDEDGLTPLDRSILPADYETVSPFAAADGDEDAAPTAAFPAVHLYQSATAIVDAVVAQIDPATADQVAVVIDESTTYSPLLEAAFEAEGIPYQGGPGFIDDDVVRLALRLLLLCFGGERPRAAAVRPLLTAAGWSVPRDVDERRIDLTGAPDHPAFARLADLRATVRSGTVGTAVDAVADLLGADLGTLRAELGRLGVLEEPVTERRVNELVYYLRNYEVPIERESEGVLLTDAGSSAYADRPVVFYLGLGEGWARAPPDYPWVDATAFAERDRRRFDLLVQNGRQRYVLAQPTRAGEAVTPCPYLDELFDDRTVDSLADLPDPTWHRPGAVEDRDRAFPAPGDPPDPDSASDSDSDTDVDYDSGSGPDPVETLSQSGLNTLVTCPRDYYFDQLVETPPSFSMQRGTVLHDAAELYVNDPAWVTDDDRRQRLLDAMVADLAPYAETYGRGSLRTELDAGLDVVDAYLSANPPETAEYDTYGAPQFDNGLADALDVALSATICERWFESAALGGHGVVDLLGDPRTLVDYKTGSVKSAAELRKQADVEEIHDTPDFQVLLYLAQHRRERPDERLEMRFVHLLDQVDEMVKGAAPDLEELVSTVTYVPTSFAEFVGRRSVFDQLTDYADSNARCKLLDTLGYDRYHDFFATHELPRDEDSETWAAVQDAFLTLAREVVGDYNYVENGTEKIFGDLADVEGYVLEDDLDAFEAFLRARLADLDDYRTGRFPVTIEAVDDDEPNWDRVDHRDLVLTGGGDD